MRDKKSFDSIKIQLASPDRIRSWSYGEVKKPETINYRTLRPEREGLFCEKIFGTTKEWECYCGKFKSIRFKNVVCDRCGVEVTHFRVRRERMGHIELATPVAHIWYYRLLPSRIGLLLDLSVGVLRSVLYYEKFIVVDPGDTDLTQNTLLTEDEYENAYERYGEAFTALMGAEAIRLLLEQIDLNALSGELREVMNKKGAKSDKRLLKRIELVENFRDSSNKPEWMILEAIPIIPPDLRPMVQLEGGRFATSDLNDLYRRVISRNNRLRRLMNLNAPDIIIRNEKRMLQEAVDALFDNSKKRRVVKGASNRPLKSLSDMLRGKQGRFRQNLLGKRVDYSGRSVIVVGPELELHQCGLPISMALELFKPFIMRKLVDQDVVYNIKKAKVTVEQGTPEVWAILEEVVKEHPIFLNRAPTLHRLGIQAFEPVLVEGKSIRLHPLVCHAYNADFDGDQMAVHVPLTYAAQTECWTLMLAPRNLLNPANGEPIVFPSLDMVLGIYHLTLQRDNVHGAGKYFSSLDEVTMAYELGYVDCHALVKIRQNDGRTIETTPGRAIFNGEIPDEIDFVNKTLDDTELRALVAKCHAELGPAVAVDLLDAIKRLGFRYVTKFGTTIGIDDIVIPKQKAEMIDQTSKEVQSIQRRYLQGYITSEERYNRVIESWNRTNEDLTDAMMKQLKEDRAGLNPVYMMADSGARGSRSQIRQLAGMRGLMAKPSGEIIELPIRSNFKEGLSVIEFFISTNGARKGLADTALKTADAGYLTRRLVDIAQDIVINEDDCGTINGLEMQTLKDGEEVVESLADRIRGRFTLERVKHPITSEVLVDVNEEINDKDADMIEQFGIETVRIRAVLTCEARHGVCRKCYGRNLATNRVVDIGEAVGIIAAQSIGQPGTQLTMRTFHIGGAATKASEGNRIFLKYPVYIREFVGTHVLLPNGDKLFTRKGYAVVARIIEQHKKTKKCFVKNGDKVVKNQPVFERKDGETVVAKDNAYVILERSKIFLVAQDQRLQIPNGAETNLLPKTVVPANETIATFDPFSEPIISEQKGVVEFHDIVQGTTLNEEINDETGKIEKKIIEFTPETLQPRIAVKDDEGNDLASYYLPDSAYLNVENGETIEAGRVLAKMLRESAKTGDITGGLPRVGDLFEARQPKNAAVLAQADGTVYFRPIVKGKRVIVVEDVYGKEYKHLIPMGKYLLVRDKDMVEAGDKLCEGNIDPHEILKTRGENALQRFLMNEVQEVYRLQGVHINDKHIEVIIRQMMRKIEIISIGDTKFIYGQFIDKYQFREENRRVLREGGQSAVARPFLLGITRASINMDSFISAASFQETTRTLTNAAIGGSVDHLRGLKENVIIGHLIPAGTGMQQYRNIKLSDDKIEDLDQHTQEIINKRERERNEQQSNQQQVDALFSSNQPSPSPEQADE